MLRLKGGGLAQSLPPHAAAVVLSLADGCWCCRPAVNGLTKAALEAIRCSQELEEVLRAEMTATEFTPWGTMERLQPLLYTWVQVRLQAVGASALEAV